MVIQKLFRSNKNVTAPRRHEPSFISLRGVYPELKQDPVADHQAHPHDDQLSEKKHQPLTTLTALLLIKSNRDLQESVARAQNTVG